jgi:hypothetical protein
MPRGKYTDGKMMGVEADGGGTKSGDVARETSVSKQTIYAWKVQYGG